MTDKNVWFVTGAGRGMGVDIAKAALAALCAGEPEVTRFIEANVKAINGAVGDPPSFDALHALIQGVRPSTADAAAIVECQSQSEPADDDRRDDERPGGANGAHGRPKSRRVIERPA